MAFFTNFLFIGVIFLAKIIPRAFPCDSRVLYIPGDICCHGTESVLCVVSDPGPYCNIFGRNCVVCEFKVIKCTLLETRCSCYYCCDKQYAEYCPHGCENCIKDGEGGCPVNNIQNDRLASSNASDNSPFVHSLKKVETARKHFDTVDADKSGTISMKEAIAYLVETKNGTSADHLAKNSEWFGKMDSNGNSQIEPLEFDRSLV